MITQKCGLQYGWAVEAQLLYLQDSFLTVVLWGIPGSPQITHAPEDICFLTLSVLKAHINLVI